MTQMFSIENVSVAYGKVEAVRNVSLSVEQGQIVTVIGPNGAGKTTLLMAAIGLLKSTGRMIFQGADLARIDVEGRVERGLCLVPEKRELFRRHVGRRQSAAWHLQPARPIDDAQKPRRRVRPFSAAEGTQQASRRHIVGR